MFVRVECEWVREMHVSLSANAGKCWKDKRQRVPSTVLTDLMELEMECHACLDHCCHQVHGLLAVPTPTVCVHNNRGQPSRIMHAHALTHSHTHFLLSFLVLFLSSHDFCSCRTLFIYGGCQWWHIDGSPPPYLAAGAL